MRYFIALWNEDLSDPDTHYRPIAAFVRKPGELEIRALPQKYLPKPKDFIGKEIIANLGSVLSGLTEPSTDYPTPLEIREVEKNYSGSLEDQAKQLYKEEVLIKYLN